MAAQPGTARPSPLSTYETALRVSTRALIEQIEAAITDPAEYIPSRIRHQTREVRAVLDYIDRAES